MQHEKFLFFDKLLVDKKPAKPNNRNRMDKLIMNRKEREQLSIFKQLKLGEINQGLAAMKLGFTTRWVREKFKRYNAPHN